jgi:hypothetical protein
MLNHLAHTGLLLAANCLFLPLVESRQTTPSGEITSTDSNQKTRPQSHRQKTKNSKELGFDYGDWLNGERSLHHYTGRACCIFETRHQ